MMGRTKMDEFQREGMKVLFFDFNLQTIRQDRVATVLKGWPARPEQVQKQQKDAATLLFWPDQTFKLHKALETGSVLL